MSMVFIAVGGALGAFCRYQLGVWLLQWTKHFRLPLSMMVVNWLGSLGLGLALHSGMDAPGVTVGFFGAFTTFSTFSVEALQLLMHKKYMDACIYMAASLFGSMVLFKVGFTLAL
jgi:CrcB protein